MEKLHELIYNSRMTSETQIRERLSKYLNDMRIEMTNIHGRKYSDAQFAQWAGVSSANMSRYLAGRISPNPENILAMAAVMPAVMIGRSDPPFFDTNFLKSLLYYLTRVIL